MSNQLIRKLERLCALTPLDREALHSVLRRPLLNLPRGAELIREGASADDVRILLSGWAVRSTRLRDGRRQILSLLLPAEVCELNIFAPTAMGHSIVAVTPLVIAVITRDEIDATLTARPALRRAFARDLQLAIELLHEAIVSIGQRNALERVAHLFCELIARLNLIGAAENLNFQLPLTQTDLAALTGLSAVHVNRTLQELRRAELISLVGKELRVLDLNRLKAVALFDSAFLHLPANPRYRDGSSAIDADIAIATPVTRVTSAPGQV